MNPTEPPVNKPPSKLAIAAGFLLLSIGFLNIVVAVRDCGRCFRFLDASYVASYSLGEGAFEAVVALVFLGPGWLLVRKCVARRRLLRIFWISVAVAVVLGINASFL